MLRRLVLPLMVLALLLAPFSAASPLAWDVDGGVEQRVMVPHPPILVLGDAGFLSPASGVRGGSGTPEDPYVISDWLITPSSAPGIRIMNTTAHVVIERVIVYGVPNPVPGVRIGGIETVDASNVTIRDTYVSRGNVGVHVTDGSRDVRVENVQTGGWFPGADRAGLTQFLSTPSVSIGLRVWNSERVHVQNLTAVHTGWPTFIESASDVTLRDSVLDGDIAIVRNTENVAFVGNTFAREGIYLDAPSSNLSVVGNTFNGGIAAIEGKFGYGRLSGAYVCGNEMSGYWHPSGAIVLSYSSDLVLLGNHIHDSVSGAQISYSERVTFERNLIEGSAYLAVTLGGGSDVQSFERNAFQGNADGLLFATDVDARNNWWGDASGPSGEGPGSGDIIKTVKGAEVAFDPWLTEAPDVSVDCEADAPDWVQPEAWDPFTSELAAHARASADVHMDESVGPVDVNEKAGPAKVKAGADGVDLNARREVEADASLGPVTVAPLEN